MRTDVWGIDAGYEDALGVWQPTPARHPGGAPGRHGGRSSGAERAPGRAGAGHPATSHPPTRRARRGDPRGWHGAAGRHDASPGSAVGLSYPPSTRRGGRHPADCEPWAVLGPPPSTPMGVGRATVCHAVAPELGDRGFGRPPPPGPLGGVHLSGGPPVGQPVGGRAAGPPAATEPLLPE